MEEYTTRLKSREEIAERTIAFHLEKPPGFDFRPGQFVDLTLLDPPETDSQGTVRTFTLASAPYENELVVATRIRQSAFKRVLATLPPGTPLRLEGPMGSFLVHKNPARAAVFLAGGIGITPFRSILRHAVREGFPHPVYLFYSNRHPEDAAFLKEMDDLAASHSQFLFIPTMTEMERSQLSWNGERRFIDRDLLAQHFCDLKGPIFYAAGPPAMVAAMRDLLIRNDVSEGDIHTEEFGGY
ncbi:MAG TPA: FAD-dependent oxidoreductase [Candidatus Dormibacteraeota bacterium]|nr:FAD-dependent oxidoreductase [Candidatus Dormibacteraeota bacterium]